MIRGGVGTVSAITIAHEIDNTQAVTSMTKRKGFVE